EDLWGDGNGNIYLVNKDEVYLHTATSCTMLIEANEDLRGISGSVSSEEVYAVGKKGELLYYNGAAWQITQEGNEEFKDDWVSDIGNAYYAAKKGELTVCEKVIPNIVGDWHMDDCTLDLPASPVLDSGPNGLDGTTVGGMSLVTNGQLCQAAGSDGTSGKVNIPDDPLLDLGDGLGFAVWVRHNATALTDWESIFAKGDSSYRLHLNGGCAINDTLPGNTRYGITLGLNGGCNNADLNSNYVPIPGVWVHVAGSYDRNQMHIYINGALASSANLGNAINQNNFDLSIGENSQNTGRHWDGEIDELTLWDSTITAKDVRDHMNRTRICTSCSIVETVVSHDNSGIHCLSESIQVDLVDSLAGTPRIDYNTQITLDTQNGVGDWSLLSGSGVFNDAVAGDGLATYDWPLGESTAVFALDYRAGPATLNIDTYETLDPMVRDQDGEGDLVYSASGFTLTGEPLSNPPPAVIAPFGGPRTAGTDMPLYLTAYGQSPSDNQCGVIETYTGPRNISFWSAYLNPFSGTRLVTIDTLAIASNEAGAAPQPLVFTNGQASVVAKYKDVGLLQILVKDDSVPHPDLPTGIRGATASFVVKPDSFTLSNIEDGSGNPNPAAAGPAGPVFMQAGQPFAVTVTARDAEGDPTPNYGRESIPESVALTTSLVAPAAGVNPPLTAGIGFGGFAGGTATGTDFIWPEVGIVTLTPTVDDSNYLTGGNVTGAASANVGRFIPDHFDVVLNSPAFSTSCAGGGFTYIGEAFNYSLAPRATVTARAATASVTQNYSGTFFKLDNTTLQNRSYVAVGHALDTAGLPPPASDPVIADLGGGVATLTFSGGTGLEFVRAAPEAPFDADISLSIDVLDADNVGPASNPVVFGAGSGISFDAGSSMRYGRVNLSNAIGSELVNLAVQQTTQVYVNATAGFVTHTADSCTSGALLSLGGWAGSLNPGETCVLDSGAPGSSGAGCATVGPPAQLYRTPPLGGDFNLFLAAPGAGNDGRLTISSDVPAWLEFDWDLAMPGLEDPTGTATFGIYSGNARRIYQREIY
ncbi:MAG: LamG domain-containing protein, partial [Gammaproteobacteria bacterium]|nr:LamG domain-containing protein [Gammaproteobacteria bacterium]